MKLGILTFHSQLNYGGVLQCWALKTALEKLGHEVVVIDKKRFPNDDDLSRGYKPLTFWGRIKFLVNLVLIIGDADWHLRVLRTQRFIMRNIKLSRKRFYSWDEVYKCDGSNLAKEFGLSEIDYVVVGSDQLWHCGDWGDPRTYLLEGAEINMAKNFADGSTTAYRHGFRAISYAVSFGMNFIPEWLSDTDLSLRIKAEPIYKNLISRFSAISCREEEGVAICKRLGFDAVHVVDPTQLLSAEDWNRFAQIKNKRMLTCYFLGEDVDSSIPLLIKFAKQMHCRVNIFVKENPRQSSWLPHPKTLSATCKWVRGVLRRLLCWRVVICENAGPVEFLRAHAESRWVITDSFHSLMFSIVFNKNVRVLAPKDAGRKVMFGRLREYAEHTFGDLISSDLDGALKSLEKDETVCVDTRWLSAQKKESIKFLRESLING